jgi:hypothetical protein
LVEVESGVMSSSFEENDDQLLDIDVFGLQELGAGGSSGRHAWSLRL